MPDQLDNLPDKGVGSRTRSGISWNLLGAVATNTMRIVVIAVLGRTLSSKDFGIVAVAISVNVVLFGIRDIGVGTAIVQRKALDDDHVATAFALSTYLGLGISLLLLAAAPLISWLYAIPEAVNVVRALGLLFFLRGVSTTSRMMSQRAMNFRTIALIDAAAFVGGSIGSMILAVLGAGPWALVAGYLLEEAIASTLYLYTSPTRVSLRVSGPRLRELMTFGTGQSVGYLFGTIANYGDNFVVGHVLGAQQLGYYARAYDLIKFPSTVFQSIVGTVLFPAFSRFQDDRERLATNFRRVTFLNALVLVPASAALIVLAPEVIGLLMGDGWDSAVLPFQILSISMLMRTSQRLGAIVAQAAGRVRGVAVVYFIYMICVIVGALFSIRWGIVGVATTTAASLVIVNIGCSYLAMNASGLGVIEVLMAHAPGVLVALVVTAVVWPLTSIMRGLNTSSTLVFTVVAVVAVAIGMLAVVIGLRRRGGDFEWLGNELRRLRGRGKPA